MGEVWRSWGGVSMAKKNDDFFKKKKDWSKVKDELLGCYLKPYIQKILFTRKPVLYIDCFAGKGVFEDGNPGSPIIALDIINECLDKTNVMNPSIQSAFIELNHADDLKSNLQKYDRLQVISGQYEKEIEKLLDQKRNHNIFLYVDPYGIKALNYKLFQSFSKDKRFNSIELLINLNSFGFIREGCRVLGASFDLNEIFDDLVEYEPTLLEATDKSINYLNEIAGGDYWQNIIQDMKHKKITAYDAEALFTEKYCERLKQDYKYVLNMPLRIKKGHTPKYRMIHATNHIDGCLLMVDNICGRWQAMKDIQSGGQLSMFEENYENNTLDMDDIREKVTAHIMSNNTFIRLSSLKADFFMMHGPICKTSDLSNIYRALENDGKIVVKRTPPKTKTGRPSTFFSDEKDKTTEIRWKL